MPCDYLKMLTDMLDANGMSYKVEPPTALYGDVVSVVVELTDVPEFNEFVPFTSNEYATRLLAIKPTRNDEIFTCQQYNISSRILHHLSELLRTASTSNQPDDSVKIDYEQQYADFLKSLKLKDVSECVDTFFGDKKHA